MPVLWIALAMSLTLFIALMLRERRVAKARDYGFLYDDNLSYNQNRDRAMRLREYAHEQADLYEATGRLGVNYRENLYDRGLATAVINGQNPYEIAQVCTYICTALKC